MEIEQNVLIKVKHKSRRAKELLRFFQVAPESAALGKDRQSLSGKNERWTSQRIKIKIYINIKIYKDKN